MDLIARAVEPAMSIATRCPSRGGADGRARDVERASDLAEALDAKAILVATVTGRTASAVARLRPRRPIVALSHHQPAVQQMALEWGVLPLVMAATARRRGSLGALGRDRARRRPRRIGRARRSDGGNGREPPRVDQRDQGRRRIARPPAPQSLRRPGYLTR